MAPNKRLRTTRSSQPVEAPTQPNSTGEDPAQTFSMPVEINTVDTAGNKRKRGVTRMADIWNLPEDEKIILECNELGQPIGNEGGTFSLFSGTLVRDKNIMPIDYTDWRNVPHRHKDDTWSILQKKFLIPEHQDMIFKKWVMQNMAKQLRGYRAELKSFYFSSSLTAAEIVARADPSKVDIRRFASLVDYWKDEKVQDKAKTARKSRSKQIIKHTSGSKSFARRAHEMGKATGVTPSRSQVFIATHKHKDGTPVSAETGEIVSQMEEASTQESIISQEGTKIGSILYHRNDTYSKFLGQERNGRVRGLGLGPTPSSLPGHGSSQSSIRASRPEDVQEIGALRSELAELKQQREEDEQQRAALRREIAEFMPIIENFRRQSNA